MHIYFISGNEKKLKDVQFIIPDTKLLVPEKDILEIQSSNAEEILRHKMSQFVDTFNDNDIYMLEDTGLFIKNFGKGLFPGHLIKSFFHDVGYKAIIDKFSGEDIEMVSLCCLYYKGKYYFVDGKQTGKFIDSTEEINFDEIKDFDSIVKYDDPHINELGAERKRVFRYRALCKVKELIKKLN